MSTSLAAFKLAEKETSVTGSEPTAEKLIVTRPTLEVAGSNPLSVNWYVNVATGPVKPTFGVNTKLPLGFKTRVPSGEFATMAAVMDSPLGSLSFDIKLPDTVAPIKAV